MRIRTFAVALAALLAVPAAQASANTIKTGTAASDGGDSTLVQAPLTNSCDATVSYRYGPSADQLTQTLDSSANPHHAPSGSDFTRISGLTEGTTYYYQAVLTSSCGNAEGAVRCFVHSSHINDEENAACPDDPGDSSGGGGDTGGGGNTGGGGDTGGGGNTGGGDDNGGGDSGGGGNHQSDGLHHIRAKGHRCLADPDQTYILDLKVQHIACHKVRKLVDPSRARRRIGARRKVTLGKFHCVALVARANAADYHCTHGHKGWWMHTYARGDFFIQNRNEVDY